MVKERGGACRKETKKATESDCREISRAAQRLRN